MKILSLDLSTKSSGWAVFEDEKLVSYGCITSSSTDLIKRINVMVNGIEEVINNNKNIDKVIAEEVRPQGGSGVGNVKTYKALMWLQAAIAFKIHNDFKNISLDFIYPSSWRAACGIKNGRGIKRENQKQQDINFVEEIFNISVNDDIADAIGIGYSQVKGIKNNFDWS